MNVFEEHQLFIPIINDGRFALELRRLCFTNHPGFFSNLVDRAISTEMHENRLNVSPANRSNVCAALWKHYTQEKEEEEAQRQYERSTPKQIITNSIPSTPKEPIIMAKTTPSFETKHFVNGIDATTLTDNELITAIKDLETKLKALREIKTESTRIALKIEQLDEQRLAIAVLLDSRS